jgi:hypothetical protein
MDSVQWAGEPQHQKKLKDDSFIDTERNENRGCSAPRVKARIFWRKKPKKKETNGDLRTQSPRDSQQTGREPAFLSIDEPLHLSDLKSLGICVCFVCDTI